MRLSPKLSPVRSSSPHVPGPKCPTHDTSCNRLNLPICLQDNSRVIITACCHSIGQNAITQKVTDGDKAEVTESTKVMFTAWQHEMDETLWLNLLDAPIQTVFKTLQIVPAESIMGPPHGRSWRAHRQAATPQEAQSFCFFAQVIASMLDARALAAFMLSRNQNTPHLQTHVLRSCGQISLKPPRPKQRQMNLNIIRLALLGPPKKSQPLDCALG